MPIAARLVWAAVQVWMLLDLRAHIQAAPDPDHHVMLTLQCAVLIVGGACAILYALLGLVRSAAMKMPVGDRALRG